VSDITLRDIEGQLELSQQRFDQVVAQIRTLLVTDVSAFSVKVCKQAFLAQPKVSDALDDERLKTYKARSAELGALSSEGLDSRLSDPTLWLSGEGPGVDERSLQGALGVWGALQAISSEVVVLLGDFGFDAEGISYTPPKYFVGGLYLPTLVEHYWRLRREMSSLDRQREDLETQTTRSRLALRWEDA